MAVGDVEWEALMTAYRVAFQGRAVTDLLEDQVSGTVKLVFEIGGFRYRLPVKLHDIRNGINDREAI